MTELYLDPELHSGEWEEFQNDLRDEAEADFEQFEDEARADPAAFEDDLDYLF